MEKETLEETKDLNYWRSNAEEDYLKVPISVLRYISELEKQQERMYSEEEVKSILLKTDRFLRAELDKWFEQFKKK